MLAEDVSKLPKCRSQKILCLRLVHFGPTVGLCTVRYFFLLFVQCIYVLYGHMYIYQPLRPTVYVYTYECIGG
jgi:hypothetical protein